MDRRIFLAGLSAGLALTANSALAATAPPALAPGEAPSTAAPAPAEVMGLGDAEKQHLVQTMAAGTVSLEMSKIALSRAQGVKIKEFAQFEIAEQETAADVLKAIKAAANDMAPPPQPDPATAMLQKLRQATGAAFDREYLQGQVQGHQQLLKIQEDYLAAGKNLNSTNVAKLARGMIKEHLTLLADLIKGPA